MNYDLVSTLALTMNTKVVHNDILNMFKLFVRSHNHFMHWLHIKLSRYKMIFMNHVPFVMLSVANMF